MCGGFGESVGRDRNQGSSGDLGVGSPLLR